jgi:hypothetical protein
MHTSDLGREWFPPDFFEMDLLVVSHENTVEFAALTIKNR